MSDDYDDEFGEGDDAGGGLIALLHVVLALWCLVVVVTWALR